jgi:hypothetical protein
MSVPSLRRLTAKDENVPATDSDLTEALTSVKRIVSADPRDWTADRHDAFIYGVFRGWDDPNEEKAVADKHAWNAEFLTRLHRLQVAVANAVG